MCIYIFHYILGSAFLSNDMFLFGEIDMKIKLIPGYSAGTVVAFYVSYYHIYLLAYYLIYIYIYIKINLIVQFIMVAFFG